MSKISLWENQGSLKELVEKSKPGWEIRLETQIRKLRKQAKIKQKEKRWNMGKKEKATQEKITIPLEEINQKVLAKEIRLKRYRQMVKQIDKTERS